MNQALESIQYPIHRKVTLLLNHWPKLTDSQFREMQIIDPRLYQDEDGCYCIDKLDMSFSLTEWIDMCADKMQLTGFSRTILHISFNMTILSVLLSSIGEQ